MLVISVFSHCSAGNGTDTLDPDTAVPGAGPSIRSVTPSTASAGERVTIAGLNFGSRRDAVTVAFADREAEIVSVSDVRVEVVVPRPGETLPTTVRITVDGRSTDAFPFAYDYPAPVIESLSALEGAAGTGIDITGTGFGSQVEDVVVTFDEQSAVVVSVSDRLIKVVVPGDVGKRTVEVAVKVKAKLSNKIAFNYTGLQYQNPVSTWSLPDPTLIKAPDGWFYLYATEDTRNMPIMRSKNLVDWTFFATAFTDATRPTFEANGGLWAPDINHIDGRYVMYYSMSVWGGEWTCGIGVAVADSPAGPFTDRGKLFRSNEIDVQNSIDPHLIEDNGKKYLFWGSFRGIYMIEMSDDGLSVKQGAEKQQVAGAAFEGVYMHKRDGYYYLFASIGSCCNGLNSTYRLVVGRSTQLAGPYLDRGGQLMMSNGYTVLVDRNTAFVGNGHCSQIVPDDDGNDWILYHGVRTDNPAGRVLLLDRVGWDAAGWPVIGDGTPTIKALAPVFR